MATNHTDDFQRWLKYARFYGLLSGSKNPRGIPSKKVPGTRRQFDLVERWCSGLHRKTKPLLVHVYASMGFACRDKDRPFDERGYVPIGAKFIEMYYWGADWEQLQSKRILEVLPHSHVRGRSREFRIAESFYVELLEAGAPAYLNSRADRVDLLTGRRTEHRDKTSYTGPNGRAAPELVRKALDSIGPSWFNEAEIEKHLEAKRREYLNTRKGTRERRTAYLRYVNDRRCRNRLSFQGAKPYSGDIWKYEPAYRVLMTGRIAQIGGGLQSCSRAMKEAAYHGIPNVDNYDLKASQPRLLYHEMQRFGIESDWLHNYAASADEKGKAANFLGVPKEAWKAVFYPIIMGAVVPSRAQWSRSEGAIKAALVQRLGKLKGYHVSAKLHRMTGTLRPDLTKWRQHIKEEAVRTNGRGRLIRNAAGMGCRLDEFDSSPNTWKFKSRLSAFHLQGIESAFVHTLTTLAAKYGFQVTGNEHDGLVVKGVIPRAAVEEAAKAVGLPLALVDFVPKRFVSDNCRSATMR